MPHGKIAFNLYSKIEEKIEEKEADIVHICGTCGNPLKREPPLVIVPNQYDLMFPPDGYEVVHYDNGNIKFVKQKIIEAGGV